ncbi:hypothetical protein Ae201684P_020106 [Aphanomyces euteiches]|uniref:Helicase-associated domain-containing protein n=1 Tax=Aphanomyces euteiches TaxID=100861 RepID=A0A6G0XSD2_9STRA|nr:hypothetical protein Ae201684_001796 [Aphanomyces euteiches]KAH9071847.1 hypothetical protein Ae201684P_020106 [Aphanomyces euteiches]KAH9151629.1 hypothetical protein AeRB84_005790 [Aphanomyces euteiches]
MQSIARSFPLHRQREILRVAQCVHELEGRPERTNLTPNQYQVPATSAFPKELHGRSFDLSMLRQAKRNGLLDPDVVAEFDAIGFPWDGREYISWLAWQDNLEAMRIYKSIHGNLMVKCHYVVKAGDPAWPAKFWGKKLGNIIGRLRNSQPAPERKAALEALGFIWDGRQANWDKNLLALKTYKQLYGDLNVHVRFVVPSDDANWPAETENMKLGELVNGFRRDKDVLPRDFHDALDAMDFRWKIRDKGTGMSAPPKISIAKQQTILEIAQHAYKTQGHSKFTTFLRRIEVPSTPEWPSHLHGEIFHISAFRRAHRAGLLEPSIVQALDAIGFVWDVPKHQWELFMEALNIYKTLHGHVIVPTDFQVPEDDAQWPAHLWAFKLGIKVGNIRRDKAKVPLERKKELDEIQFVWNANQLHRSRVLLGLKTYKRLFGTLYVPQTFVVPSDDPMWPAELADMKLGAITNTIRARRSVATGEWISQLDSLGFEWRGRK